MSNPNDLHDPFNLDDEFEDLKDNELSGLGERFQDDTELSLDGDSDDAADLGATEPSESASASPTKPAAAAPAEQPKPFIKTKLGLAVIGGCVAMLAAVGIGVSGVFTHSATPVAMQEEPAPQAFEPAPAPTKAVLGNAASSNNLQISEQLKPASAVQGVIEAKAALQDPNPILHTGQAVRTAAVSPAVVDPTPAVSSNEVADLRASIVELKEQTEVVVGLVKDVNASIERLNRQQSELTSEVQSLKADLAKATVATPSQAPAQDPVKAAQVQADQVVKVPAKPASVTDGRNRLAGLQVIDTSQNGEMSIIKKASNGRIFTLYPNEIINWGGNRQKVTGIEKEGSIVLVGEKFFIDKVLEEAKAEPKPAEAKPVREVVQRQAKRAPVAPAPAEKPASAQGFSLNAVYDSNRAFGVVNDKGEFKSYKIGDTIEKLGKVTGLTPSGDLQVGDTVIKSVY